MKYRVKREREMEYWYVEVPITEGKFCKRFDSPEEAEKEAEQIRNGEKTELRGYGTEVCISSRSTRVAIREEQIVDCAGAELQASRIEEEKE